VLAIVTHLNPQQTQTTPDSHRSPLPDAANNRKD
jgi:hypothetical protein